MEALLAHLARFVDYAAWELARRDVGDWLLVFAPLAVFLELPRYLIPPLVLALLRRSEVRRDDPVGERARAAFLNRRPTVSCILAGRNERATIAHAVRSLFEQDWAPDEILVVDDASDDGMLEAVRPLARDRRVRLVRNVSASGRAGRPTATNLGLRLARGEIVVSLDADTTFDRAMLRHLVEPFADPEVGVVAGNVRVRNSGSSLLARLQRFEYALGIEVHKRFTDLYDGTLFASGAVGAFRRAALVERGGWSQDVAEDADVSLHLRKAGWRVVFAPAAVARTNAPRSWRGLLRQRARWDSAGWKLFFGKHRRAMRPSVGGWGVAVELACELVVSLLASLVYPLYVALLFALGGPFLAAFVLGVALAAYTALSLVQTALVVRLVPELGAWRNWIAPALAIPLYRGLLRWGRVRTLYAELCGLRAPDPFLPETAWRGLAAASLSTRRR
ncbi:MAG TPA: glycosyltransferase [Planctomycetota bacterium]|nr:glycosyltransferase [Planctomycetota bacterium]